MMTLSIQIKTFLVSILFGILFSLLLDIFYKTKLFNIILSLIIVIVFTLIYFLILLKLNNAIIHPYYIFSFVIGFLLEFGIKKLLKKIVLFKKKWYNFLGG